MAGNSIARGPPRPDHRRRARHRRGARGAPAQARRARRARRPRGGPARRASPRAAATRTGRAATSRDREQVDQAVEDAVAALGGLDVVVANAGIAAQLPLVGGDPAVMERTIQVNVLGVYYTLRAAGPHISHTRRLRAADRVGRRRRAPAADGRLQRVEGGGRGARQHAAHRAAPVGRAGRRRLLRRDRHGHDEPRLRHRGGRQAHRRASSRSCASRR